MPGRCWSPAPGRVPPPPAATTRCAGGSRSGRTAGAARGGELARGPGARAPSGDTPRLAGRARIPLGQPGEDPDAPAAPGRAGRAQIPEPERLGLTTRELEVLRLVAAGRSNRDIADELFISVKTASVHVSNILGKLGVTSRGQAAATPYRLRLFDSFPPY